MVCLAVLGVMRNCREGEGNTPSLRATLRVGWKSVVQYTRRGAGKGRAARREPAAQG